MNMTNTGCAGMNIKLAEGEASLTEKGEFLILQRDASRESGEHWVLISRRAVEAMDAMVRLGIMSGALPECRLENMGEGFCVVEQEPEEDDGRVRWWDSVVLGDADRVILLAA